MTFLLDTNAFSDLMREDPRMDARLASVSAFDRVITCPIVRGEIRFGITRLPQGKRRQQLEITASKFTSLIPCAPIPAAAADYYASIKLACERKGLPLDENDLWIAATALALDATLVTRDNHFQRVENLMVEDWTQ